ncbi:hypothetical protein [Psychrobacter sp. FDAARGOS_221]|uniref:hypothetical protein n=1 Tax=Psychrobacter sp. FDAARGOS_221 TaxID=1975705 RepID=UPI000BB53560|nr:hypothetical protein [Psychrobacter sp. FDAARGOS_221]PNK59651.1 hypothetical protein A6J60_001310 [Psychrobacter sp. FDAARGOS_221]
MTHYFGFEPTDKLKNMIDDAEQKVSSNSSEPYYPLRNDISHQIAHEIIENLLVNLISVIPDEERKEKMKGIVSKIEGAADTMLNILLGKDKNKDVLPNFEYLKNETVFEDNDGNTRIGFKLDDSVAQTINDGFDSVTDESVDKDKLQKGLMAMNHAVVDHFITRFSETLPLGMFKRNAVPVAKAGINKALEVAINKLFPQLPLESLQRLVAFYRPYVIEKA